MKRIHQHRLPSVISALLLSGLSALLPLSAQILFTGEAYTENFNSLPNTTTDAVAPFTFTNNETLLGWYSTEGANDSARASAGKRNGGTLYSWGGSTSGVRSDRALGLFAGDGYTAGYTAYLGLQLLNDSGATIDAITLTFDVEQWRKNTTASSWQFSWLATPADENQLTASDYTNETRGDAASIINNATTGSGVNGNSDDNRYNISITLTAINWQDGEYLWLRWGNAQTSDAASGIGLDNLTVAVAAVPEPAALTLALGILAFTTMLISRRRK